MTGSKTYNNTTTSAQENDLPAWAKPYFERNLMRAEAEFGKEFTPYTGERIAGQSGDTLNAIEGTRAIATGDGISGLGNAQNYMTEGMAKATELGNYNPNSFNEYDYTNPDKFTGNNVAQYMNPFMQNVVDGQKRGAVRDFQRAQGLRNSDAISAGAFGGSRGAVQNFLAEDSMLNRMGDLQDTGLRDAYSDASTQFSSARTADMDVDKSRAGERSRVETDREAADQFAATHGLSSLETGANLAKDSVALGELERQTDIQDMQLLEGLGAAEEGRAQTEIDLEYEKYLTEQGYTQEQISNMTSILAGQPIADTGSMTGTSTTPVQKPGALQQVAGAGLTGVSLYKAYGET
jgi:hypothetical protein